jgi:hypothetical protein
METDDCAKSALGGCADDLVEVPRIYDMEFKDLFYNRKTGKFLVKRRCKKVQPARKLRELAWNTIRPKLKRADGTEKVYEYHYVLIPHGDKYIRVKEGEIERYWTELAIRRVLEQDETKQPDPVEESKAASLQLAAPVF